MTEAQTIIDVVSKIGPFGLIVLFCWLVGSGRVVLKREFDREREGRVKAEAMLEATLPVVQRAIGALERVPELTRTAVDKAAEVVTTQTGGARR